MTRANLAGNSFNNLHFAIDYPARHGKVLAMKVKTAKKYKRNLSRAAIERMSAGGRKGSVKDKSRAGKAGWQALRDMLSGK